MSGRFATLILLGAMFAHGGRATAVAQGREWRFGYQSATPIRVPDWLRVDSLRAVLSYDVDSTEAIAGFLADLNRDGVEDYVFRFSRTGCGTNCEYALVDGRTHRTIGRVGGSVVFVGPVVINGYPVIRGYGHSSVDAGEWSTAVFNGQTYEFVGSVFVEGSSQARLFRSLEHVPFWPPPAVRR